MMLPKIPTGCVSIDKILDGGLSTGDAVLVYGEPETGKTTLAMQCAVNCAKKGCKTLFIDCDRTFSTQRLSQIASENLNEIAEQIMLMKPESFRDQTCVIDRLAEYVNRSFGLVVIDTLTSLYRLQISESPTKTFDLNRELNRQTALLVQVARAEKIAVMMTSQVTSVFNDVNVSVEPVATRVLKFWADIILVMKPTERPGIIRAVMEKSPKGTRTSSFDLRINDSGIHDYHEHR